MADDKKPGRIDVRSRAQIEMDEWELEQTRPRTEAELDAIRNRPRNPEELAFIKEWGLDKTPEERAADFDEEAHWANINELAEEVERRARLIGADDNEDFVPIRLTHSPTTCSVPHHIRLTHTI